LLFTTVLLHLPHYVRIIPGNAYNSSNANTPICRIMYG
jgi:hypothetical protein